MTFTPKEWKNLPTKTTPIDAESLENLEVRTTNYSETERAQAEANAKAEVKTEKEAREAADALLIPLTQKGGASGLATLNASKELETSQIPLGVVSRRQNATSETAGAPLAFAAFYLSEWGWKAGEDGTKAMQEIIDYAVTNGLAHVEIRLPPLLELNSAPRTDRQGNAIVALPEYGVAGGTLRLVGYVGGSEIITNQEGLTYSAEHGCPSIIGGPTPEQLGIIEGKGAHFSSWELHTTGHVIVRAPNNPTISGIDASRLKGVSFEKLWGYGKGSETVEPTHPWAIGLRLPEGDNGGRVFIGQLYFEKWYAGVVGNSAHIAAQAISIKNCILGFGIMGNTQDSGNDGHSSSVLYLLTEHCKNHIGSWSPVEGAISIPEVHPAQIAIHLWDVEDIEGIWQSTVNHLLDANNQISGFANYARVIGNVGPVSGALTVSGARNFGLYDITVGPLLVNPHGLAESTGTIGLGLEALKSVTTATGTTAIGYKTLAATTTEPGNTAVGHEALSLTTGQLNTAVGRQALSKLKAGNANVAIGRQALINSETGEHNIAIGVQAGEGSLTNSNCVFIGYQAGKAETTSNKLYIASSSTTEPLIWGDFQNKELRFWTTKIGLYGVAPTTRAAAITSPAAEVAPLKVAVDALREAVKKIGITE